jgi:hypothetical protein
MHDLRQRRCPIITPTLLCAKFADVRESSLGALSIGVQSYRKKQNPSRSQIVGL